MKRTTSIVCNLLFISIIFVTTCKTKEKKQNFEIVQTKENANPDTSASISQPVKADTINITSINLLSAYIANEVKADYDYKGKILRVTGVVEDIKKGLSDNVFIVLDGNHVLRAVQCFVNNEETARKLSKGMKITFIGKCEGLMANVLISNCTLLEPSK